MSKPDIKQFKLANGEEIICEVLEWDNEDSAAIVVRGIVRIIESEDWKSGVRLIAFRPFMAFSEDPSTIQTLNSEHIMSEAFPGDGLLKMYVKCIRKIKKDIDEFPDITTFDVDDLSHMSDEELGDHLKEQMNKLAMTKKRRINYDSDTDNVVQFKPKDKTFH